MLAYNYNVEHNRHIFWGELCWHNKYLYNNYENNRQVLEVQFSSCRPDGHNGSIYTDGYISPWYLYYSVIDRDMWPLI